MPRGETTAAAEEKDKAKSKPKHAKHAKQSPTTTETPVTTGEPLSELLLAAGGAATSADADADAVMLQRAIARAKPAATTTSVASESVADAKLAEALRAMVVRARAAMEEAIAVDLASRYYRHHAPEEHEADEDAFTAKGTELTVRDAKDDPAKDDPADNEENDGDTDALLTRVRVPFVGRSVRLPRPLQRFLRTSLVYFFLLVLAASAALLGLGMDLAIALLRQTHTFLAVVLVADSAGFWLLGLLLWALLAVLVAALAALLTDRLAPTAVGSGIPEVRAVLNGVTSMSHYLSLRTLLAKVFGLTLAVGSGMHVGKEGPYVHIGALLCNNLLYLFRALGQNHALRMQLIGAACGVGVAAHFGSILGGVLFSIEVTSTYYPVRNYWFAGVGTAFAGVIFRFFHNLWTQRPFFQSLIITGYGDSPWDFHWYDLLLFTFIGISLGPTSSSSDTGGSCCCG